MLVELYGYQERGQALLVPSVTGLRTAVYTPLLSYTDLSMEEAVALKSSLSRDRFQIRVLDSETRTFQPNETVTMRLNLASGSVDHVFNAIIPSACRNRVRKSEKAGMEIREGVDPVLQQDLSLIHI